ncbi:MAG: S53 family peptidase [Actinomycetota bacterium]|nr:S53 family peptidase [Actinomycetota bacterium]
MTTHSPDHNDNQPPQLDLRPLPGSERPPAAGYSAAAAQPLRPDARVDATVILRRRAEPGPEAFNSALDPAGLAAAYGASPQDLELVTSTFKSLGATVLDEDAASRRVRISAPSSVMCRIFGTDLQQVSRPASPGEPGGTVVHRHRTGGLSVPAAVDGVVTAVLGLDDRPQSRARFRIAPAAVQATSYTPLDLGRVYNFPEGYDGSGQTIAILELGGGFDQADLDVYFQRLGITGPTVTAVGVDGAANQPGQDPTGADGEVLLDIEVAGALAPGANIVVYFAPNTDAGFLDALSQAAHAQPTPAAVSISWGQSEDDWTAQARNAFDQACADAALLGITVTAAAGDDGSTDRAQDGKAHVDFPAASPHVLACGGTRLEADPVTGTVQSETVWNNGANNGATGGGVSRTFTLPVWQKKIGVPSASGKAGRGVPDVSAVADPQTGYRVRVDGKDLVIGGTSAVSPLWAALIARLVQATGQRMGLAQRQLYHNMSHGKVPSAFRDITSGDNGAFAAAEGWDACTGLGVPDGAKLLAMLEKKA